MSFLGVQAYRGQSFHLSEAEPRSTRRELPPAAFLLRGWWLEIADRSCQLRRDLKRALHDIVLHVFGFRFEDSICQSLCALLRCSRNLCDMLSLRMYKMYAGDTQERDKIMKRFRTDDDDDDNWKKRWYPEDGVAQRRSLTPDELAALRQVVADARAFLQDVRTRQVLDPACASFIRSDGCVVFVVTADYFDRYDAITTLLGDAICLLE